VLVVGGGITGCATAYELARAGADVHLVDRFDLNTQGSGYNAGSLHAQIQHEPFLRLGDDWARAYAPATRFLVDSIERWRALPDEVGGSEDADDAVGGERASRGLEIAIRGGVLVAETEAQLRDVERKVAIEREQGLDVELLWRDELRAAAPYVSERMVGGELCRNEGKANPLLAAPAFARAARAHGATISLRTALVGLAREGDGFVARTSACGDAGDIACRRVVSCGGVDAGRVTAMLGADLPVHGIPIQASVTEPVAPLVRHLVYFAGEPLTLKQAAVGSVLIGGGWPARVDVRSGRPIVDERSLRANLSVACKVVPAVARLRLLRTWAGHVNAVDDWRPIIGEVVPGVYVGVFPWMGFTAGPLMGEVLAGLVLGRPADRELAPFSPARF
jgi:sarcosine oxidase, subunit beta